MSANYLTQVSFLIRGTPKQLEWLDTAPSFVISGAVAEMQNETTIWVHSDESVNIDDLVPALQEFLAKFSTEGYIEFQWVTYADRDVPNSCGGGALLISKDQVWGQTTADILVDCRKEATSLKLTNIMEE